MIDNLENGFGDMVNLMQMFIQCIFENVLSQDAELVGIKIAKSSILYKFEKTNFPPYSLYTLNVPDDC